MAKKARKKPDQKIEKTKIIAEYAWNWFSYHAAQRMITFRFFLIMVGVISVGYSQTLANNPCMACGFSALGIASAALFWRLDYRSRDLISVGENFLLDIEKELDSWRVIDVQVVLQSRQKKAHREAKKFPRNIYSHRRIFNCLFGLMILASLIAFVVALWKAIATYQYQLLT